MYREFSFTSITTSAIDKSIVVFLTAEVDPQSVSGSNIQLLDCETNHFVLIDYKLSKDKIIITLPCYPAPNSKYKLCIKGIVDIVGNELKRGINYDIQFTSSVKNTVNITTPAFAEEVDELIFELDEQCVDNENPINSFYIEVATDNLFNNIIFTTSLVNRNSIKIMDLNSGQYYARARVQDNNNYGKWCQVVTFVLNKKTENIDTPNLSQPVDPDGDEPIFYKPLTIVGVPKDGDDTCSFFIELSDPIDPDSLENITVYRRLV